MMPTNARPDIYLKPLVESDAQALAAICAKPETSFLEWPSLIRTVGDAQEAIKGFWVGEGKFAHFKLWWGVWHNKQMVGTVMLRLRNGGKSFGLPPFIAPQWRGRGFGHEAVRQALKQAASIGYFDFTPRIEPDNEPMQRLYKSLLKESVRA